MQVIKTDDVREWLVQSGRLGELATSIGSRPLDDDYVERVLGMPGHLRCAVEELARERGTVPPDCFDSIPFFSLCKGLLLPLSSMAPEKVAHLFKLGVPPPPDAAGKERLIGELLRKDIGLSVAQKLGCVLGDPFHGKRSTFRRDSLVRLLMSVQMAARREILDRLTVVGDVAVLFAESRANVKGDPPLTAAEVLESLRTMPRLKRALKFRLLRSLWARCGRLEAYFLAKLVLRKAGFGFEYQGPLLARAMAEHYGGTAEQVLHAMALTDAFKVAGILAEEGLEGLRKVRLQPLVPVRPALASGSVDANTRFPVWVERKYDGIRLMAHKSTDDRGSVLCGAYTRTRRDWLELVPGLDQSLRMLPAHTAIVDGELYGTVVDLAEARPASVYEVHAFLQGERARPVNVKYAAFDLLYLNGRDLTGLPLVDRRRHLAALIAPIAGLPLPLPIQLAEGQQANSKDDVNRLYHHFRSQGYEGIITKDASRPYLLAARDPTWLKRKPAITLDLVLLGAVLAVTEKSNVGTFGSYVIGARDPATGGFEDVGDVAGLDRLRDAEIQATIMREGLITGRRIERQSASGVRPGLELRPNIVVTVRFEGVVRDSITKALSLRDPKAVMIRSDKSALEADTTQRIEQLYLSQTVG